jgi:hypothetical protein
MSSATYTGQESRNKEIRLDGYVTLCERQEMHTEFWHKRKWKDCIMTNL